MNNLDIAKQHANDRRQELEQCRLIEQTRSMRNEKASLTAGTARGRGIMKSCMEAISRMGRRLL